MNTGQMIMTLFAMILLTTLVLSINQGYLVTHSTMSNNRIDIMALSLANSIIEDATSLPFDAKTVGAAITGTNVLTPAASLGLDNGESRNNPGGFTDFDDYNCYRTNPRLDTLIVPGTQDMILFRTYCAVDYITADAPDQVSASATYHKRIKLRIYSPGLDDTIRISTVYSYWYFR